MTTEQPMLHTVNYELRNKRIWVAGHRGLVGSALVRRLAREDCEVVTAARERFDLRKQADVEAYLSSTKPHAVVLAAARVGGIRANSQRPADFIHDNLAIEVNVIEGARRHGVEKMMFLGSSCIYPRLAPQPIAEDALLTGPLEGTNQWYAIAKIAGLKLCEAYRRQHGCDFISVMPPNLYGPGDNFHPLDSHVVPALIVKAHNAKLSGAPSMDVWGSGRPRRELLFSDDAADGLVFMLKHYSDDPIINLGSGSDASIAEIAERVCHVVGFKGTLKFDPSQPDGTPQKLLNSSRATALGWSPKISLDEGLAATYRWYLDHRSVSEEPVLARA